MLAFLGPVGDLYRDEIVRPGREIAFFLILGFIASFAFIRMSTRLMRSPRVTWWPGSIETEGGLHIHHMVFGIVIVLVTGFLAFTVHPDTPWLQILALLFGVGAGLTLDEWAMILHVEDVYWSEEGRQSIDAVILATMFVGLLFLGFAPLDLRSDDDTATVIVACVVVLAPVAIAFLKGKFFTGFVGLFIPIMGLIGAIRLAKPSSPWARWRYRDKPRRARKLARSRERHARLDARRTKLLDAIGGAPSAPEG